MELESLDDPTRFTGHERGKSSDESPQAVCPVIFDQIVQLFQQGHRNISRFPDQNEHHGTVAKSANVTDVFGRSGPVKARFQDHVESPHSISGGLLLNWV